MGRKRIGRFRDKNRAHIDRIYEVKCQESTKCPDHPTINLYRFEMYVRMHYKNIPLYINLYLIFNNMFDDNVDEGEEEDDESGGGGAYSFGYAFICLDANIEYYE